MQEYDAETKRLKVDSEIDLNTLNAVLANEPDLAQGPYQPGGKPQDGKPQEQVAPPQEGMNG